VHIKLVR